jgi:hypothetical protein
VKERRIEEIMQIYSLTLSVNGYEWVHGHVFQQKASLSHISKQHITYFSFRGMGQFIRRRKFVKWPSKRNVLEREHFCTVL